MKVNIIHILKPQYVLVLALLLSGCVTKKRKGEVTKLQKFYHNTTSEYNGYFNANELMIFALEDLSNANIDNYTEIISLYDYLDVQDPKMVSADMDKAIEKVTRVAMLHEPGDWVDDCYVLMGKAQYLKQDYQTAIETFEYFQEDFNPANPYGRNFKKKKLSAKQINKQRKKEREQAQKERKKQREALKKEREKAAKSRSSRSKSSRSSRSNTRTRSTTKSDTMTVIATENTKPSESSNTSTAKENTNKPVKAPQDKTAYNEGLIWLAKSYIRAGKYSSAEFLLNRLEKIELSEKEYRRDLLIAQADLMIQTGKYDKAVDYIDQALKYKADRDEKGRWAFVAGQLMLNQDYYREAKDYFAIAKKKSTDYKMKFMATINSIKCSQLQGGRSKSEVAGALQKLLKETKYAEFQDQIYFALGEINANEGDLEGAKENFSKAVSISKDPSLKSEAYYRIGTIAYDKELYVDAKNYFDSTLTVMPKTDMRYKTAEKYAANLKEIAKNLETIAKIDTALALSNKSPSELNEIAKARLKKEQDTGVKTDTKTGDKTLFVNNTPRAVTSNFWAYNAIQKEIGIVEFKNKWGDRPLVDNWRLESKYRSSIALTNGSIPNQDTNTKSDNTKSSDISEEEYNRVMADVPRSPLEKSKLEDQLRKAQFELGKQFRDKIQNYARSASTLEDLNKRFGRHLDLEEAYFYLYLDYVDLGNTQQANYYKNILATEYAETKYGKIASDPDYVNTLLSEAKKVERYYEKTFELFQQKKYEEVNTRYTQSLQDFGREHKMVAKFSLLNAMAMGYTQGQQAYLEALNEVIVRYPNTPEETKAKEIMRLLKGDSKAFSSIDVQEVDNMFVLEDDSRHYVVVLLYDKTFETMDQAKISVSEYNKKYHSTSRLQLGEFFLNQNEELQLILVRSFPNMEKAMEYYNDVQKKLEEYIPSKLVQYEIMPISTTNHRKMLQQKTHTNYRAFFEKNYLNK